MADLTVEERLSKLEKIFSPLMYESDPLALSDTERRKQFGGRVRVMRELLGFTQAELAAKVGISQQSIATYETGRREPPFKNLIALARVFNTSIDWLVTGSELKRTSY